MACAVCKKIAKSGCNVLLIQKSILRDAVNELSLHFLAQMKILVIKDIERDVSLRHRPPTRLSTYPPPIPGTGG